MRSEQKFRLERCSTRTEFQKTEVQILTKKPGPKITRRKVDDYQQDEGNPNAGSRRGQEMIDSSYRQHGAGRSWLADKERRLIEGNHSQFGALEAGIEEVWEIEAPPDVQVVVVRPDLDLDDPDTGARDLSIGANRSAQASITFDVEQLLKAEDGGADLNTFCPYSAPYSRKM